MNTPVLVLLSSKTPQFGVKPEEGREEEKGGEVEGVCVTNRPEEEGPVPSSKMPARGKGGTIS